MAKRFTDTDKWKRPWFNDLDLKAKFFWMYLLDNCDHRGVWLADFKLASFQVGFKVTATDVANWFGPKIQPIDGDKYFIRSFVDFQYGDLSPTNNAHKTVIKLLSELENSVTLAPSEDLGSPTGGAQDKDKDKDKDMDMDKEEGESEGKFSERPPTRDDWILLAKQWPRSEGRTEGVNRLAKRYKTREAYDLFENALRGALAKFTHEKQDLKFVPHFSTFVGTDDAERWRDLIDWKPGLSKHFGKDEFANLRAKYAAESAS